MLRVRLKAPTRGTRIAIWMFPAWTLYLGWVYAFGSRDRLLAPSYQAAESFWSLRIWGFIFIGLALCKIAFIIRGGSRAYAIGMCLGMGLYAWWGVLFAGSALADPHASLVDWPVIWVVAHAATLATLTQKRG